jgi:hypothetical protein
VIKSDSIEIFYNLSFLSTDQELQIYVYTISMGVLVRKDSNNFFVFSKRDGAGGFLKFAYFNDTHTQLVKKLEAS